MTEAGRLTTADGADLAGLAAEAVRRRLAGAPADGRIPVSRALRATGASFVTLETAGALRGCIGTLEPARPLYRDVTRNAIRAMSDPRLPPVTTDEWPVLDIKVSVLSGPEPLLVAGPAELLASLRPGVDGLILADDHHRATFLPAVWAKLPDRALPPSPAGKGRVARRNLAGRADRAPLHGCRVPGPIPALRRCSHAWARGRGN